MLIAADRNPYAQFYLDPMGSQSLTLWAMRLKVVRIGWRKSTALIQTSSSSPHPSINGPPTLEQTQMSWLHPGVVKRVYSVCQLWNLTRKLHRASLFAYLHQNNASINNLVPLVRDFELQAASQLIDQHS